MSSKGLILAAFIAVVLSFQGAFAPVVFAAPLVPCGTETYNATDNPPPAGKYAGDVSNPCGWNDFIKLVTNVTNYIIILGVAVSALAFGWAGFLMMTAGGEMSKIEQAKSIFGKVLVGFLIMLSAWLIVHGIEAGFEDQTVIQSLLH